MGDFNPPGRLSSYKHADKTIQVQTEYAPRPRPRVTTSVVLDGRIIHKLDRPWEDGVETGELQKALETSLAEQHRQAMELVKTRAADYVAGPTTAEEPTGYSPGSFRDSMVEVLGSLPFVIGVYEIDRDGKIVYAHNFRDIYAEWDGEFEMLARLAHEFPNIIRVGDFRHGNCWFPAENVIIVQIHDRTFGIMTEPSGSIDDIRQEFPELFEAVYG
jgi:hypothetical protein